MNSAAAQSHSPLQVAGNETPAPLLLTLLAVVSLTFVLMSLGVFDRSVYIVGNVARAELIGTLVAGLAYAGLSFARQRGPTIGPSLLIALLPVLAAAAFLGLEALSLLLCPVVLDISNLVLLQSASVSVSHALLDGATPRLRIETAAVAFSLAMAFFICWRSLRSALERQRMLRYLSAALLVATLLLFLVPIGGPLNENLPLPVAMASLRNQVAVARPRTGSVCLPAVVAISLLWTLVRSRGDETRSQQAARWIGISLCGLVVVFEALTGRYGFGAIAVAAVVVAVAWGAARLLPTAPSRSREAPTRGSERSGAERVGGADRRARLLLTVVFFCSGVAALVYQVVFAKGLALTFGSTSHASTIVLATYMGGLALGSWMGGKWAAHLKRPVIGYAMAELGVALLCAAAPLTLKLARFAYVTIAQGTNPSAPRLIALQLALGAMVLVPPTWLMGLTMPLLARRFLDDKTTLGASAGLLYTANTLGAATGASLTGYFILPHFGIVCSLFIAVATNVIVAVSALVAARLTQPAAFDPPKRHVSPDIAAPSSAGVDVSSEASGFEPSTLVPLRGLGIQTSSLRLLGWVATIQLTIGGFVTFGLETTCVHLLATVAGTSAYAFSLMLFAFLIGLGLGSSFGRARLPKLEHLPQALLLCQFALAATLLVACRFWDNIPSYFTLFGRWPYTLTFASREFVRFVVCLVVMLPPSICIGAQFPIAMEAVGAGWPNARIQALGRASALNTLGNIVGALVIGFYALPRLGSHRTLAVLTLLCLCLAALTLWLVERGRRTTWGAPVVAAAAVLVLQPPEFDLTRLSAGGNVYFTPQYYGRVIDHAESLDGGLTAVAISHENGTAPVKTLLTNGKFQGNNRRDSSGEMMAQTSFAVAPLLHTARRERALVIGFGTGTTTRVLDEAGFQHIALAELSGDIIALADRHFSTINNHVIHRPNVEVNVTDGRNFLLLDRRQYDLISIELSSIWFAGAANLYNDEFYALVEPRLGALGVLQQWVQLHRLSHRDIVTILYTMRRRFPWIWLYSLGKQGIIIACKVECSPDSKTLDQLRHTERLNTTLAVFRNGLDDVLNGRLLTPAGIDRLIDDYRRDNALAPNALISTDDNLYLEYSTPKGNVREYDESIADNTAFLSRYRAVDSLEGTQL